MTIAIGNGVELVTRGEWGARQARSITGLDPTYGSTGHWEGPHMGVFPHESCAAKVRGIQGFHMDARGWQDIAYTYVVCPHGFVFEGRGIGVRTAANGTNVGNSTAYAVCYLGGEGDGFTAAGARAMRAAFDRLDGPGRAGPGRNGHRDWKSTACPGNEIYHWVHAGQPVLGTPESPAPATPDVPQEDTLSAEEVKVITDSVTAQVDRVRPFIAQVPDEAAVWLITRDGTKRWVSSQAMLTAVVKDGARYSAKAADGTPLAYSRTREHLASLETVGPVPPGW